MGSLYLKKSLSLISIPLARSIMDLMRKHILISRYGPTKNFFNSYNDRGPLASSVMRY